MLEGRGCVLLPGLFGEPGTPNIKAGAKIQLQTPTGKVIDAKIAAIEFITYRNPPEKISMPLVLPEELTQDDIPIGTKVILVDPTI